MVDTVTIPAKITGSTDHTYTNDDNIVTGLAGGMHTVNLIPMFADSVKIALYCEEQVVLIDQAVTTVIQSPSTSATSSTSMTVGFGSKSFTLNETGKAYAVGQTVNVSNTSGSAVMTGIITAYDKDTGAITVNVSTIIGSGTLSSWVISVGAIGGGVASALGTTGASVSLINGAPPITGNILVAISPTEAGFSGTYGLALSFGTSGTPVSLATTPPIAGQLMTALTPTSAAWQDPPRSTPDYLLINSGII